MSNCKILIISYLFPPAGGIAVQRALSLAKYLPQNGFDVHVLMARNTAGPVYDPDLVKQIPKQVTTHTAFTPEIPFHLRQAIWRRLSGGRPSDALRASSGGSPGRRSLLMHAAQTLLSPEPEILWVPFAYRKASKLIRTHDIDVVLITAPPFSAFLVGTALKRRFPGLRLVADFRDEWLTFYLNNNEFQNTKRTRTRAAAIERTTVHSSDLVVAVTDTSLREIRQRYPDEKDKKFRCIPNGYDPDAFAGFKARRRQHSQVIVTHVGTVYSNASPRFYLHALAGLPTEIRERFETRFIGRVTDAERAFLKSAQTPVRAMGFLPQAEALGHIEATDYLLVTMTDRISIPGKLYEYLATGKPVLAIAAESSELAKLLHETGGGWSADPDHPEAIRNMLVRAYERVRHSQVDFEPNWKAIQRYARPRLAAEYAGAIRNILAEDGIRQPSAGGTPLASPATGDNRVSSTRISYVCV